MRGRDNELRKLKKWGFERSCESRKVVSTGEQAKVCDNVEVNDSQELIKTIPGRILKYTMYTVASRWAILHGDPMPMDDVMQIRYEYGEGFKFSMS